MKKFLLTLVTLFLGVSAANAQLGIHARLEAGASLSKVDASFDKVNLGSTSATGYRIGAAIELPVAPIFYIAPGVALRSNSIKYSPLGELLNIAGVSLGTSLPLGSILDATNSENNTYILVPVNLGFKLGLGGVGVLAEVGPYAGYALNGSPLGDLGKGVEFNRFSYGVGASVALRLSNTYFKVGYEHELSKKFKVSNQSIFDDDFKFNDSGFYFTIGQRF